MTDQLGRPSWDDYFFALAFVVARRSLDPSTKHGAIVVDQENTPLAIGFNSPPRYCSDLDVPLTRPEKYSWMIHAERAAIINAARTGTSLRGSTVYVTGHPCAECFAHMISAGVERVMYGPVGSKCVDDQVKNTVCQMRDQSGVELIGGYDPRSVDRQKEILENAAHALNAAADEVGY